MRRDFDIFEKFPDHCTIWRARVSGQYEARRKMQAMAELSENEFFAIDLNAGERLPPGLAGSIAQKGSASSGKRVA